MREFSNFGRQCELPLGDAAVCLKHRHLAKADINNRLYVIGFCGMVYVVLFKIKETNYPSEDGVIAPQKEGEKCESHTLEEQTSVKGQD